MRSMRLVTVLACACAVVPLLAQLPMQPGNWETTVQMDMPNMPVKMPEMKTTQCVTQADIDNPARLANVPGGNDSCKVTDQNVTGNKVTWKMTCSGPMAISGDGELVFDGDTYKGTINSTTEQGNMTLRMAGKRLGAC